MIRRRQLILWTGFVGLTGLAGCRPPSFGSNEHQQPWSTIIRKAEDIPAALSQMTLRDKVGQLVQTDVAVISPKEVREFGVGSIISLIPDGSLGTPEAWRELADSYQRGALGSRTGIPVVFAIDAVHGHSYFDGNSVILPHNIGLGATRNPTLVRDLAAMTARELSATGVRWSFSPTIAVARNIRWGRTYESFGEDVELQQLYASALVDGYQGGNPALDGRVGATAKHFVADGATIDGIDRGDAQLSEAMLRRMHLPGFVDAINQGVVSIMASFSSVNGEKVHGSKSLLTGLLKEELGFDGVVVTDWEGVRQSGLSLQEGLEAGIDLFMFAESWRESLPELLKLVQSGKVSMARVDDAVTRVLRMKLRLGLFDRPFSSDTFSSSVGSAMHRDLARQAVRESMVLLKNDGVLPLSKSSRVVVVGTHADNVAFQCGGWTKKWQGAHEDLYGHAAREVGGATSILAGIQQLAGVSQVVNAGTDGFVKDADTVVVVVGEIPYAELIGDRQAADLVLKASDRALIRRYHDAGKRVVTVLISGRPLIVNEEIELSAAFVAAWLPGSEGLGIAQVLYGDDNFRGKLGFSWPRHAAQIPISRGDPDYDPLYPYGFGLDYNS